MRWGLCASMSLDHEPNLLNLACHTIYPSQARPSLSAYFVTHMNPYHRIDRGGEGARRAYYWLHEGGAFPDDSRGTAIDRVQAKMAEAGRPHTLCP